MSIIEHNYSAIINCLSFLGPKTETLLVKGTLRPGRLGIKLFKKGCGLYTRSGLAYSKEEVVYYLNGGGKFGLMFS